MQKNDIAGSNNPKSAPLGVAPGKARAVMMNDVDRIRDALQFINAGDRETWVRMGMAIKSQLNGDGFDLWDAWSQQSDSYNPRDARDVWKSIRADGGLAIGTLFYEAKANGWHDDGGYQKPTPEELAERRRIAAERAAKEDAEIARERANTASNAAAILGMADEVKADHPYLVRKKVSPTTTLREIDAGVAAAILGYTPKSGGNLLAGRLLVAPVKQGGRLSTLELIDEQGRKAALAGRGSKAGGYWATATLPSAGRVVVCEGVATALSIAQALGEPVVAALSVGNIKAVAEIILAARPGVQIVIAADLGNEGRPHPEAAKTAATLRCLLAVPPADLGKGGDLNDLHARDGLEAVRATIESAIVPPAGVARLEESTQEGDYARDLKTGSLNGRLSYPKVNGGSDKDPERKKPIAKVLIQLALELGSLWHDSSGAGWVDFVVDGILQTARIRSKRFRDFLSQVVWTREERAINSEAWLEAAGTLDGLARFNHQKREAFLRVGQHQGDIYIDLGSNDWSIIRVSANGWQTIPYSKCPIRFYRSECQLPLPIPTRGSLDNLWRLLNFKEADRPLVVGWLLSCLVPDGAKPIMALSGEKGSGKSSAATLLKRLTDPTKVSKASAVGDQRQIASAAAGRWVLSFDNLTYLSNEQQDLLCCVSTGAGFSHRTLYTDLEETFLEYRRPQILTGVDLVPTRSDLLDRSLIVRLDRIPEEARLPEIELEALTVDLLPGIYGSLLDLLVAALRNLPTTKPTKLPRMADLAKLCIAAGIPGFMDAYTNNIAAGCYAAIESNPVAAGILAMLESVGGNWQGTASELVKKLQEEDPTNRDLQKMSGDALGRKLSRSLKTDLEAVGVVINGIRTSKSRMWILTLPSETSKKVSPSQDKASSGDTSNGGSDTSNVVSDTSQNKVSLKKHSKNKAPDTSDTSDTSHEAYLADSAHMSEEEEAAIRAWSALIGETDPEIIAEVIERCRVNADARGYFIGRARAELPAGEVGVC